MLVAKEMKQKLQHKFSEFFFVTPFKDGHHHPLITVPNPKVVGLGVF